jgi:hypothetical protein
MAKQRTNFRQALLTAAQEARAEGEITRLEYLLIWMAPAGKLAKAQEYVTHEAVTSGVMATGADPTAFDWASILAFIKELLPLILQIFGMFGVKSASADVAALIVLAVALCCCGPVQAQCRAGRCEAPPVIVYAADADQIPAPALTPAEASALRAALDSAGSITLECGGLPPLFIRPGTLAALWSPTNAWWDRGPVRRWVSTPWRGRPALRR